MSYHQSPTNNCHLMLSVNAIIILIFICIEYNIMLKQVRGEGVDLRVFYRTQSKAITIISIAHTKYQNTEKAYM